MEESNTLWFLTLDGGSKGGGHLIYYTYLPVSTYRESYSEMGCIAGRMRKGLATI